MVLNIANTRMLAFQGHRSEPINVDGDSRSLDKADGETEMSKVLASFLGWDEDPELAETAGTILEQQAQETIDQRGGDPDDDE